ncbi:hypothetical protein [Leptospira santarosai]
MSISFHRMILEDGTLENMMELILIEQDVGIPVIGVPTFLNSKNPF